VPDQDALIVERIRHAGAITIGKTNVPNSAPGRRPITRFRRDAQSLRLTKTCGGSSGGAAVALACGMIPIADGSDMGGSLRNRPIIAS
jgi:amidase